MYFSSSVCSRIWSQNFLQLCFRVWCVFVVAMDAWRWELKESLQHELEGSDDEDFEEGLLEMFVAIGGEGSVSPPSPPKFGGSRMGRIYIYWERERAHELMRGCLRTTFQRILPMIIWSSLGALECGGSCSYLLCRRCAHMMIGMCKRRMPWDDSVFLPCKNALLRFVCLLTVFPPMQLMSIVA